MKLFISVFVLLVLSCMGVDAQEKSGKNGDVYFIVEEMPDYPGGQEALRTDIAKLVKYPKIAQEQGIQGKVYVTFLVNEEGKIANPRIARGVDSSLDKEALRVMNALDKTWKPGKEKGKAVKVSYTVPINFALGGGKGSKSAEQKENRREDGVFFIVEEMPEFPGGDSALREFIAQSVKYPEVAKKNGIKGKVYVTFVVDVDGSVTDTRIARGVDPSLDKESLRVVSSLPKWKPGKEKGEPVKVCYTVPINFALE